MELGISPGMWDPVMNQMDKFPWTRKFTLWREKRQQKIRSINKQIIYIRW